MSERQTRITKLKLEDGKISISYQKPSTRDPDEWLDYKLTSEVAPHIALLDALKSLKIPMLDLLEMGHAYGERFEVCGLNIKYRAKDGAMITSIVAKKVLRHTAALLELKSPSLAETAPDSNPDDHRALTTSTALAVNEVVEQCLAYLRERGSLTSVNVLEDMERSVVESEAVAANDESPG